MSFFKWILNSQSNYTWHKCLFYLLNFLFLKDFQTWSTYISINWWKKLIPGATKWHNQIVTVPKNSLKSPSPNSYIYSIHLDKKRIVFRAWRKFILIIKVLLMAAESQKLSHSKKIKQRGRKLANICAKLVWRLYTTSCVLCLISTTSLCIYYTTIFTFFRSIFIIYK